MGRFVTLVIMLITLTGCASPKPDFNRLSVGMTKAQVIATLGQPKSTRATEDVEYLMYDLGGWRLMDGIHEDVHFVRIKGGVVDSFGKVGDFGSTAIPETKHTIDLNVRER